MTEDNIVTIQIIGGVFVILFWLVNWRFIINLQNSPKDALRINDHQNTGFIEMVDEQHHGNV